MPVPRPVVVPREQWQDPRYPIITSSGSAVDWLALDREYIHWPGGANNSLSVTDPAMFHRNMVLLLQGEQRYYHFNRGYPLGYTDATGPNESYGFSTIYEIRGAERRCAANGNATVNRRGQALQIKVARVGYVSAAQVRTARWWIRAQRQWATKLGNTKPHLIRGHRQAILDGGSTFTACPSDPIQAQVDGGVFDPANFDPNYGFYSLYPFDGSGITERSPRDAIRYLQAALVWHADRSELWPASGVYDDKTVRAVWDFQRFFKISDVFPGVCGPPTRAMVNYLALLNA